ncbi:fatty acyl-CoA reductase wat-like [Zophobas morio]|uniref:fatty acyl-CoA reductase wat-like n=1 Tax=Zophobas morio TaxID=2755281 RepID=UPI003082A091
MLPDVSQIKTFFQNQTVFLTGGSGFLGKVLIEKLLRECEEIEKIYVLMRTKKNKTPEERFEELFNYACFDLLKSTNANSLKKVCLINGDCQQPLLGLSDQDVDILLKETTCVIHAAANVKFDQSLKEATYNVRATRDLLELAKRMKKLKVFVFVSTAYSNCVNDHIKEDFYEPPMKTENLFSVVNALDDQTLVDVTPQLLKNWPNTYIFGKSISEDVVNAASEVVPVTIVRPAIVTSTLSEPMPGWIDNFYGVIGIVAGAALGVIRTLNAKHDALAPLVPVDYVSNCVLAAAWKRGTSDGTTTIYNYVGDTRTCQTWQKFMQIVIPNCWSAASEKLLWYYCFDIRENKTWNNICVFFMHTVPAYVVDFILICFGKPTIAVKSYRRLNKMLDLISYFSTRSWVFDNDNVMGLWNHMNEEDKRSFFFSMEKVDWNEYAHASCMGARLHLLKDTPDTIPKGERKIKIMFVLHYTVIALLWYLLYKFVALILGFFF